MRFYQLYLLLSSLLEGALADYGPIRVDCPLNAQLRDAKSQELCKKEQEYLVGRKEVTSPKFVEFYEDLNIPDVNVSDIDFPTISLAISGGGFRSMLISSGFILGMHQYGLWECISYIAGISGGSWTLMKLISAEFNIESLTKFDLERLMLEGIPNFDIRNHDVIRQSDFGNDAMSNSKLFSMDEEFAKELKQQSILSKRGVQLDFYDMMEEINRLDEQPESTTLNKRSLDSILKMKGVVEDFFRQDEEIQEDDLKTLDGLMDSFSHFRKTISFYLSLHRKVRQKKEAGFPISFTDYLGQALMDRLPIEKYREMDLFSSLTSMEKFKKFEVPFPLIIANAKSTKGSPLHNILFEFSPFEFGSWHSEISKFLPMEFLGSEIENGKFKTCVHGFDNLGFITATSSSLFNNALLYIWKTITTNIDSSNKLKAIKTLFTVFGIGFDALRPDYAIYQPNPFYKDNDVFEPISSKSQLLLVDGGEDGENVPLRPMLLNSRKNDVLFIIDSSSDRENLPDMTKLRESYSNIVIEEKDSRRVSIKGEPVIIDSMPYIPTKEELYSRNFSYDSPIAFGCHLSSFNPRKDSYANLGKSPSALKNLKSIPPILIYHGNFPITFQSNTSTFKLNYTREEYSGMLNNGHNIFNKENNQGKYLQCLGCIMLLRNNNLKSSFCDWCTATYCYN